MGSAGPLLEPATGSAGDARGAPSRGLPFDGRLEEADTAADKGLEKAFAFKRLLFKLLAAREWPPLPVAAVSRTV